MPESSTTKLVDKICKNCNGIGKEKIRAPWLIWTRICSECKGTGKQQEK